MAKESVRDYLRGVKAHSSLKQSLGTTLRQYFKQYTNDYGIYIEFIVPPELEGRRISASVEAELYLIIQEALTNVRKHSEASSARVMFALFEDEIRVTVEDDGSGFDPEEISGKPGFGLRAMVGRAEAVGGRLELNSTPGKGTQLIIQVPLRKEET